MDATVKTFHAKNMRDGIPAQKRLVASFHGTAFIAEREDDELNIFHVSGDYIATNTTGDAPRVTTDTRVRLSAPRTSITPEKMQENVAAGRAAWDKMCGCGR